MAVATSAPVDNGTLADTQTVCDAWPIENVHACWPCLASSSMGLWRACHPSKLISPVLAQVVLGCLVFALVWVLIAFERVPFFPVGRTGGALVGASLMVACGVLSSQQVCAIACAHMR